VSGTAPTTNGPGGIAGRYDKASESYLAGLHLRASMMQPAAEAYGIRVGIDQHVITGTGVAAGTARRSLAE